MEMQISMFETLEDPLSEEEKLFRKALLYGSVMAGGNKRIVDASILPNNEFVEFLKKEFSWSGHSMDDGFCNFDSKGLQIWRSEAKDLFFPYSRIAEVYYELINNGKFVG